MASWAELAQQGFDAASLLQARSRHRACVSRAYYAAFAKITGALIEAGQTPRPHYGTWSHTALAGLVHRHLLNSAAAAGNLAYAIERLYQLRLMADYQPDVDVNRRVSLRATGLMGQVFQQLAAKGST
jgi:uncharacterized protein (UPF0332 family)